MDIKLNEKWTRVENGAKIKELVTDEDLIILNGFATGEDKELKEGDKVVLIKKGRMPKESELEELMMARHTPGVFEKLKRAKVGIAGVGGLGSNIAISLARMGVGTIYIVDFDVVEPSNLNRQQYYVEDIGKLKVEALKDGLSRINPFLKVVAIPKKIDEDNIGEIFKDVDIVIEAFDNPTYKAMISNYVLTKMKDKFLISASGMAGYFSSNSITTKKIRDKFYLCGDLENEAKEGSGLMAPRVAICANHMANMAVRILVGEGDV